MPFSPAFRNLSFRNAIELCFVKLRVTLFAVNVIDTASDKTIACLINPDVSIDPGSMSAFVLSASEREASRVSVYCSDCHRTLVDPRLVRRCLCPAPAPAAGVEYEANAYYNSAFENEAIALGNLSRTPSLRIGERSTRAANKRAEAAGDLGDDAGAQQLDSSGLLHWCAWLSDEQLFLSPEEASLLKFEDHIVLCVVGASDASPLGLCNFVMPLRHASIPAPELRQIVIIGESAYLRRELRTLRNFPKVWLLAGSPLSRAHLLAANVAHCNSCAIVNAQNSAAVADGSDPFLLDKESTICTLLVKSIVADACGHMRRPRIATGADALACAYGARLAAPDAGINLLTELLYAPNAAFLVGGVRRMDDDLLLFEGFASGHMFSISVFDSLLSTAYFTPDSLLLVQAMLSGGLAVDTSNDFWSEQKIEHELRLSRAADAADAAGGDAPGIETPRRNAYRVRQYSLHAPPLSLCVRLGVAAPADAGAHLRCTANANARAKAADWDVTAFTQSNYRELFLGALSRFGIVCLGLYRKMDLSDPSPFARRCVSPLLLCCREFKSSVNSKIACSKSKVS